MTDLSQLRIVILAEADPIYCLSLWERTVPLLTRHGAAIVAILLCPPRFGRLADTAVRPWYEDRFGRRSVRALDLFAVTALKRRDRHRAAGQAASFADLAAPCEALLSHCAGPNDPALIEWLRAGRIDVLLVNTGHIVGAACRDAVRLAVVNQHESLLPAHAGVFPYLHCVADGDPPGLSIHVVTRDIDRGPLLAQARLPHARDFSLIGFQSIVIDHHGPLMVQALAALRRGDSITPPAPRTPSYHTLPTRTDVSRFLAAGGHLVTGRDILQAGRRRPRPNQ